MCGRVSLSINTSLLCSILDRHYDVEVHESELTSPRYNIGPQQKLLSLIDNKNTKRLKAGYLNWNYPLTFDAGKTTKNMINARSETISKKKSFKDSFLKRRCLIVVDGFYEWKKIGTNKVPYFCKLPTSQIFTLAGIYKSYSDDSIKNSQFGFSILTTEATPMLSDIHHRMPVIISPKMAKSYLNPTTPSDKILKMLVPYEKDIEAYEVSTYVNSTRNEGPKCIEHV